MPISKCPLVYWNNDHGFQCSEPAGHSGPCVLGSRPRPRWIDLMHALQHCGMSETRARSAIFLLIEQRWLELDDFMQPIATPPVDVDQLTIHVIRVAQPLTPGHVRKAIKSFFGDS